jgi:hypothetical protein
MITPDFRARWNIVAVLLLLGGGVWFLQGIGVIQGSFMSNTAEWTLIGALLVVIGVGLLFVNNRRKPLN